MADEQALPPPPPPPENAAKPAAEKAATEKKYSSRDVEALFQLFVANLSNHSSVRSEDALGAAEAQLQFFKQQVKG